MKTSTKTVKRHKKNTNMGTPSKLAKGRISIGDDKLRDALALELLAVCMDTLKEYGLTIQNLSSLARRAIKNQGKNPTATLLFQDVSDLGRLANEWIENPIYVDAVGRPKVLPIAGRAPSFSSLVHRYFPRRPVDDILKMGHATRVLERLGSDNVGHLGPCVLLTGNPALLLGHAVRSIRWFLGNAHYNAKPQQGNAYTWPERQAFTELPEEHFQEFLKVMREPIINLTEMGNRWLMARAAEPRPNSKKIMMGVQAYLFRDK